MDKAIMRLKDKILEKRKPIIEKEKEVVDYYFNNISNELKSITKYWELYDIDSTYDIFKLIELDFEKLKGIFETKGLKLTRNKGAKTIYEVTMLKEVNPFQVIPNLEDIIEERLVKVLSEKEYDSWKQRLTKSDSYLFAKLEEEGFTLCNIGHEHSYVYIYLNSED